jgi:hypothetical protein
VVHGVVDSIHESVQDRGLAAEVEAAKLIGTVPGEEAGEDKPVRELLDPPAVAEIRDAGRQQTGPRRDEAGQFRPPRSSASQGSTDSQASSSDTGIALRRSSHTLVIERVQSVSVASGRM